MDEPKEDRNEQEISNIPSSNNIKTSEFLLPSGVLREELGGLFYWLCLAGASGMINAIMM
jgi:hypothetical protein